MSENIIKVLDHGYIKFIESWGGGEAKVNEAGIIEAARQSTQGAFRGWDKDKQLLSFLFNNNHMSPFEFAGMTIEIQAPIVVFREWHRHRTQSYNEMSARYAPLPNSHYTPTPDRCVIVPGKNLQANPVKGITPCTLDDALQWLSLLSNLYAHSEQVYQDGLTKGIPKEVARLAVTVGRYSRMRATANLRNWLGFLTLRLHPDAQQEIRVFAEGVNTIIKDIFPNTWELFNAS